MSSLAPVFKQRFFDNNGTPLAGGKLYSYLAGTTTPSATYTDSTGVTPNANPVVMDANGYADVWIGAGTYKFKLTDSSDVEQWTVDSVSSTASGSSGWTTHSVTDGQASANLTGETVNSASYSSADYSFEIIRGTTVFANGVFSLQYLNSTWRIQLGQYRSDISHGVTFSLSGTTIAQLRAALDSGAGDGTIKLSRKLIPA